MQEISIQILHAPHAMTIASVPLPPPSNLTDLGLAIAVAFFAGRTFLGLLKDREAFQQKILSAFLEDYQGLSKSMESLVQAQTALNAKIDVLLNQVLNDNEH